MSGTNKIRCRDPPFKLRDPPAVSASHGHIAIVCSHLTGSQHISLAFSYHVQDLVRLCPRKKKKMEMRKPHYCRCGYNVHRTALQRRAQTGREYPCCLREPRSLTGMVPCFAKPVATAAQMHRSPAAARNSRCLSTISLLNGPRRSAGGPSR